MYASAPQCGCGDQVSVLFFHDLSPGSELGQAWWPLLYVRNHLLSGPSKFLYT